MPFDNLPDAPDAPDQPSSARRRLLRGVMAGAAVLPVGAGATSVTSNLRCLKNTVDPGVNPPEVAGGRSADKLAPDKLSRVPLYKSTKGTKTRYWVKGADLFALKGNTAPIALPTGVTGTNWLLSSSDNGDTVPDVSSMPASHGSTGWTAPTQDGTGSNRYVAVRFDNAGNMLGTSDYMPSLSSPKNNSAIHRTCWSSFSGVNFNSLG